MGPAKGRLYAVRQIFIRLLAAAILTLLTTRGMVQLHIDGWLHLSPCEAARVYLYLWKEWGLGYGHPDYHVLPLNGFGCLVYIAASPLGGENAVLLYQHLIYLLTYFIATYAYDLFREVAKGRGEEKLLALVATVAYFFNPVTITMVHHRYTGWTVLWASAPLLLLFMVKFLKNPTWRPLALAVATANTPITTGIYSVGIYPALLLETLTLYLLYRREVRARHYLIFLLVLTAAGAVYLAPQMFGIAQMAVAYSSPAEDREQLEYTSQFVSIVNIARLSAYYGLYGVSSKNGYFPYLWASDKTMWAIYQVSTVAVFILFLYLIYKLAARREAALLALVLILLFVMKGLNPPGEEVYSALFTLSPTFFRHPYDRFAVAWSLLYILLAVKTGGRAAAAALALTASLNLVLLPYAAHPYNTLPPHLLKDVAAPPLPEVCGRGRILVVPTAVGGETSYNYTQWVIHPNEHYPLRHTHLPHMKTSHTPLDRRLVETLAELSASENYEDLIRLLRLYGFTCIIYEKAASAHLLLLEINRYLVDATPLLLQRLEEGRYITPAGDYKYYKVYTINNLTGIMYTTPICRINITKEPTVRQVLITELDADCREAAPGLYLFTTRCTLTTRPLPVPPDSAVVARVETWTFNAVYTTYVEIATDGGWRKAHRCNPVCNFTTTWGDRYRISIEAEPASEVTSLIKVAITATARRNETRVYTDCKPSNLTWIRKSPVHYLVNGTDVLFAAAYDKGWATRPQSLHTEPGGLNHFSWAQELVYAPHAAAETALYIHYAALLAVVAQLLKRAPRKGP